MVLGFTHILYCLQMATTCWHHKSKQYQLSHRVTEACVVLNKACLHFALGYMQRYVYFQFTCVFLSTNFALVALKNIYIPKLDPLMQPINDIMINYGLACAPYSHGTHRPVINIFMHTEDTIKSIVNLVIFYLCYTYTPSRTVQTRLTTFSIT